jgi:hypothetical protein
MEMSQGNSLCSYIKQMKTSFSFIKLESSRAEQVLPGGGRESWYWWERGKRLGNGAGG